MAVSGAPVGLMSCRYNPTADHHNNGQEVIASFANLSSHLLLSVAVRVQIYDVENSLIGTGVVTVYNDATHPIASGDTQSGGADFGPGISEPASVVRYATCRVDHAEFIGHRTWQYGGAKWPEHVRPLPAAVTGPVGPDGPPPTQDLPRPNVHISVASAWNDTVQGALFVHCALDIQGGNADATVAPSMLVLTMQLANGGRKSYGAMTQAAPTYQKLNPLGQTTQTAYEVNPKDDLGAIGPIIVPAHGAVHVIATFFVGTDVVADPMSNRQVSLQ
jgi:hypothetical protein